MSNNINSANDIANKINNINNKLEKVDENFVENVINKENTINKINNKIEKINNKIAANIPNIYAPRNTHLDKKDLFKEIGILDPEGKNINPMTGEPYKNLDKYKKFARCEEDGKIKGWTSLPMWEQRKKVLELLYDQQVILLTSGTGSGKSVFLPKFALHVLNYKGRVVMTNPKRDSTRKNAEWAAKNMDVVLGEEIGYAVKDDKKVTNKTKIIYATDGYVLAKMRGSDPLLKEYDCLIIDEAHERKESIDLLMLEVKEVLKNRPEFKLVIMSATIDVTPFMKYYESFGIKHFEADSKPNFDIEEHFLPEGKSVNKLAPNGEIISKTYIEEAVKLIMDKIIIPCKEGDILVFFPSPAECDDACRILEEKLKEEAKKNAEFSNKPFCIQLTGQSKNKIINGVPQANLAIGNSYKTSGNYTRKIVMATEVAESSLTLDSPVMFVVDTGLVNEKRFYPETDIDALERRYISKASHKQRKGRTGRIMPGTCYNLFTKSEYENEFKEYAIPPILITDVTPMILRFMTVVSHVDLPFKFGKKDKTNSINYGEMSLNDFIMELLEQPKEEYISESLRRLYMLDAIRIENKKGYITPLGKALVTMSRDTSPQMARAIIEAFNYKCANEVIGIASILEQIDGRLDKLFDNFKTKYPKNSSNAKKEQEHYKKVIKGLSNQYGDHISIYKIYDTFIHKQYNIRWVRGKEVLEPKSGGEGMGQGTKWAKDHFISSAKLTKSKKLRKDLNRALGTVIRSVKYADQNGGANTNNVNINSDADEELQPEKMRSRLLLFRDDEPKRHDKIEDNIIQALIAGYSSNIVQKVGKSYATCFPKVQTIANIDRGSLFNNVSVKPTNCFYSSFLGIFGVRKFSIFSKIPEKVAKQMDPIKHDVINECSKRLKKSPILSQKRESSKFTKNHKRKGRDGKRSKSSHGRSKKGSRR